MRRLFVLVLLLATSSLFATIINNSNDQVTIIKALMAASTNSRTI